MDPFKWFYGHIVAIHSYKLIAHLLIQFINDSFSSLNDSRHGTVSSQYQHQLPQKQQHHQQQQQQYLQHQKMSKSKRSKSMDDFSTQMLFEQCSRVHKNSIRNLNDYYYHQHSSSYSTNNSNRPNYNLNSSNNNNNNTNNALIRNNHQIHQFTRQKKHMRHSVDNLLEIDTTYYNNLPHQVKLTFFSFSYILYYLLHLLLWFLP